MLQLWSDPILTAKSDRTLKEIVALREEIKTLVVTVVFWVFEDWHREVYRAEDWEKPWLKAYQIRDISKEKFDWILTHPDYKEAVNRYFPNI